MKKFIDGLRKWCGTNENDKISKRPSILKDNKGDTDFIIVGSLGTVLIVGLLFIGGCISCGDCLTCGNCSRCISCCSQCAQH